VVSVESLTDKTSIIDELIMVVLKDTFPYIRKEAENALKAVLVNKQEK
jgi:hypothetical protein